jgi:hypothetical protein
MATHHQDRVRNLLTRVPVLSSGEWVTHSTVLEPLV